MASPRQLLACLGCASLLLGCSSSAFAQQQPGAHQIPTSLKERQELMRLLTQQQESVLQQRFNCINRATNLADLERCERGYSMMRPGWPQAPGSGSGGWRCPMW